MENAIEINNLSKFYGEHRAVDGISFSVEHGSLFAFLGVNGAGKSTTINVLCSLLNKDGGTVTIDGLDLDKNHDVIKKITGIVFQTSVLDDRLTVRDNLTIRASYYGLRGNEWRQRLMLITDLLELGEILDRPFGKLSGGQKRRADVARGLINSPKVLYLDEPTTGLDPATRRMVWSLIARLRAETGMTVFLTTHYMEEADGADKVVIIDHGKVVAEGTPTDLKARYATDKIKLYRPKDEATEKFLTACGAKFEYSSGAYLVAVDSAAEAAAFIRDHYDKMGEFEVIKGDMDDVFLNATGKAPEGGDYENK